MPVNLYHKKVVLQHFTLHYLTFKNVNSSEFIELYDAVNDSLYENKAAMLSQFLSGDKTASKAISKVAKKVFDEVNWPVTWFGNSDDLKFCGTFTAISGANIKTFLASGFISKIIDTPDARVVFLGEVVSGSPTLEGQIAETQELLASALAMVGLSPNNVLISQYYSEKLFYEQNILKGYEGKDITDNLDGIKSIIVGATQLKKSIMASFFALQSKNANIKVESIKLPNRTEGLILRNTNCKVLTVNKISNANDANLATEELINFTLASAQELLQRTNFQWNQLTKGIAYFKDISDAVFFKNICKEKQIPIGPILLIRPDSLPDNVQFEFEAEFANANEG